MTDENDLASEMRALRGEVERLNTHPFLTSQRSTLGILAMRFAGGLAFGLGTVLGGSLLLTYLIMMLTSIDFIPVVGEWAAEIAAEMNSAR